VDGPSVAGRYDEMVPTDLPHFPLVPHRSAGVDCNGSIVPEQNGDLVTLRCNLGGAVVGSINAEILKAMEQAISDQIVIHRLDEMDAPRVLTSISEECKCGECDRCPGHFHRPDAGDEPVFCVHECHKVGERGVSSIN